MQAELLIYGIFGKVQYHKAWHNFLIHTNVESGSWPIAWDQGYTHMEFGILKKFI